MYSPRINSQSRLLILPRPNRCTTPRYTRKEYIDALTDRVRHALEFNHRFSCTISLEVLEKPVYEKRYTQHFYEKKVIEEWIDKNQTSPLDNKRLRKSDLRDASSGFLQALKQYKSDKLRECRPLISECRIFNLEVEREAVGGVIDELTKERYRKCGKGCILS